MIPFSGELEFKLQSMEEEAAVACECP